MLNLINYEPDIDQIYLYAKDSFEAKYQWFINKREGIGLKYLNDTKAFIEYSNDMNDIYKNIEEYNPNTKRKVFVVVNDIIANILNNKKFNPIVTELLIRGEKLKNLSCFCHTFCCSEKY